MPRISHLLSPSIPGDFLGTTKTPLVDPVHSTFHITLLYLYFFSLIVDSRQNEWAIWAGSYVTSCTADLTYMPLTYPFDEYGK